LQVRGPWVIGRYYREEASAVDADNWFDTGDVAALHPDGTMQITDRAKDVIKSGGEWISSVELENLAVGCPGVAEAAAIGVHHPRWEERPILLVVRKPDAAVTAEAVLAHLAPRVARWWLPDAVLFVDSLPHTATGKLLKSAIRAEYRDYRLTAA
jgi:fatty-acyl-CoA synthase